MSRHNPLWQQGHTYPAREDRQLFNALWPKGAADGGPPVKVAGSWDVTIPGPGHCAVPLTSPNGAALCHWDSPETVSLDQAPSTGSTRTDLVVCQVHDSNDLGGTANDFMFVKVTGTVNAGEPAVPANSYLMASIVVPGGGTNLDGATLSDRRSPLSAAGGAGTPIGGYLEWPVSRFPPGFLEAAGQTLNVSDYPELYNILKNDYGGVANSTFILPNRRNRFGVGAGGTFAVGSVGGSRNMTTAQMPVHSHGIGDPGHGHGVGDPTHGHQSNPNSVGYYGSTQGLSTYSVNAQALASTVFGVGGAGTGIWIGASGTGISVHNSGSGSAYDPPYIGVYYLIRAK